MRAAHAARALLLPLTLLACDDGGEPVSEDLTPDAAVEESGIDETAPVFAPDRVLDIDIDIDSGDWEVLRRQARSLLDILGASCLAPPVKPFDYFPATITIDGEEVTNVGVRKKGFFGSLSESKPSLKIKFSEYVPGQRYSGLKRMTLNNAISDASYVRQCIGYELFAKAGLPSPRCNFARVTLNGEYLGVYVNVEGIKKQFIGGHFDDNDGNLYEGALSDFRPGWVDTFQRKSNKDLASDRSDIEALVPVLEGESSSLLSALEAHVDLDHFLTFWAMEVLVGHADGYVRNTNNFYVYRNPEDGRFNFIPWGIDSILHDFDQALPWEDAKPPRNVWTEAVLARRLYDIPESRAMYDEKLKSLLDEVWDEQHLLAEVDRIADLIDPYLKDEERDGTLAAQDKIREFIESQRARLETDLAADANPASPPRDPWCIDALGGLSATFDTTWGTTTQEELAGAANIIADMAPRDLSNTSLGSKAGIDPENGDHIIQLFGSLSDGKLLIAHLVVNPDALSPMTSSPVDWLAVSAYLITIDPLAPPESQFKILGILGDGVLELAEAGTNPGDPIVGSLTDITIYESIF